MIPAVALATSAVSSGAGGGPSTTVSLAGGTAWHFVLDPLDAHAGFRFTSDGNIDRQVNIWVNDWDDWGTPNGVGIGADFEIRATKTSGLTPSGSALSTWLPLSADQSWYFSRTSTGTSSCTLTIEIRDVATSTVQDSASYTISAEVDSGF